MDALLHSLGGLLLKALPTFLLFLLIHFYLKTVFFRPLEKVLHQRHDATEGARLAAESSLAKAKEKAAEYEMALKAARSEVYREIELLRQELQLERAARIRQARTDADATVRQAKAGFDAQAASLRKQLEAESDTLADQIVSSVLARRAA